MTYQNETKRPVVAHIHEQFLPISETFIYQFMKSTPGIRSVAVYAERRNAEQFPWNDIYLVRYPGRISPARIATAALRLSHIKPFANSLEAGYTQALRRLKPDLVHAHFGQEGAKVMGACRRLNIPLVVSFYGYDFSTQEALRRWGTAYGLLFRQAASILTLTQYAAKRLADLGCPPEKITVIHAGLPLDEFHFQPRQPATERPVHFIGIGRLVEKKGTRYVIEALAKLRSKYPDVTYTHIGTGPLAEDLSSLSHAKGVAGICRFLGAQPPQTVRERLAEADILLMPSVTAANGDVESQGVALQEGQAMGLPVIATRHNGFPEGMIDGKSGYLVPERDPEALAERMAYLVQHQDVWEELGKHGRAYIETNYNSLTVGQKMAALYYKNLN